METSQARECAWPYRSTAILVDDIKHAHALAKRLARSAAVLARLKLRNSFVAQRYKTEIENGVEYRFFSSRKCIYNLNILRNNRYFLSPMQSDKQPDKAKILVKKLIFQLNKTVLDPVSDLRFGSIGVSHRDGLLRGYNPSTGYSKLKPWQLI